jgi:hypothetical protein
MDRFDDDNKLMDELRELRPTPRHEYTEWLDERAAAGFPRRPKASQDNRRAARKWRTVNLLTGRLGPALGAAFVLVIVAIVVVGALGNHGGSSSDVMTSGTSEEATSGGAEAAESAGAEEESFNGNFFSEEGEEEAAEAGEEAGGEVEAEESAPEEEAEGTEHSGELAPQAAAPAIGAQKAKAAGRNRDIERSAYVVLGTKPGEVSAAAAKVYTAVHQANGIVLQSSVQSGSKGATGATFELLIPSGKLNDTLAAFSSIAEVRERHDATNDITAPTVNASEELADSNASIESLLKELGDAETEEERESVEARLHEERRRHAAIRASLDHLHERASLSEVSLRIVTGKGAGVVAPGAGGDDHWNVGDAAHDAGQVLTVVAGVILIGLAVLGPIAAIALLIWLGNRFRVRRLRERTLG